MKVKTAILFILLFFICNANANIVSNLQGEMSVNSGTLNYNIPLNVPVGTAGIQAKVSLFYSSNGLNGYFGEGWNIAGLSSISRCASNVVLDGKRKGVTYDNSDNICLDGQRLALVSGSQWGNNSEYRTKIDSYSKIVYDGVNFRVWTKGGDIKEYTLMSGNWFLSKISDRFGNSVVYNYSSNSNEIYLQDITYADNKIQLNYEDKLDKSHAYTNGNKTEITKRVKSIEIKSANQTLRTYTLTYATQSNSVDKSILDSLTECSNDSCLESLKFEYTQVEEKFVESIADPKMKTASDIYLDFNGDGHIDIYNNNSISYGQGNGQFSEWKSTGTNVTNDQIKFADFDGDGDIDILLIPATNQPIALGLTIAPALSTPIYYYRNDNGEFNRILTGKINNPGKITDIKLADFNADGYIDVYISNAIYLRDGNGIFNLTTKLDINAKNEDIYLVDLNGDGFTDIYEVTNGIDNIYINDGSLSFEKKDGPNISAEYHNLRFVDLNGDGIVDIYQIIEGNDKVWINHGKGDFFETYALNIDIEPINFKLEDINADGFVDIIDGSNNVWLNDGSGNFPNGSYSLPIDCSRDKIYFADLNSDGMVDIIEADDTNKIWFNAAKDIKLISITDSFKNKTTIEYKHLTDNEVYKKNTDSKYPDIDIQTSLQVVSSITSMTSNEEEMKTSYNYEGLKVNMNGLGSLGYAKIITINELTKIKTVASFYQNYPYIGLSKNSKTYLEDELIAEVEYKYDALKNGDIYAVRNLQQVSKSYEDGQLLKTVTLSNNEFNDYGNTKTVVTNITDETTGEIFTQTAHNTYINDASRWILARLIKTDVTSQAYGQSSTRTSSFTYDVATGILKTETIEPSSSKWLKKSYTYDNNGNKIKESISGADILTREISISYDELGKFPIRVTNALGHSESRVYNPEGQVIKLTSPNGLVTTFSYDNFGKKLQEIKENTLSTTYSYSLDASLPQSYYSVTIKRDGAPPITTYYSKLNQEIRTETIGFDGRTIIEDLHYDKFGNVIKKSSPYVDGEIPEYIYIAYDKYQRIVKTDAPAPDNQRAIDTNIYSAYSIKSINAKDQVKSITKNVLGKITKVEEEENAYQLYSYDAVGNLVKTTDAKGNEILLEYDMFGNKIYQNDPDMGEWSYSYNSLGELLSQRDAKGQTTTTVYDKLGRKVSENSQGEISTWEYDTTKKGQLHKESKPNFTRIYAYDDMLRLASTTTTIDSKTFTKSFSYDQYSRIDTKTLPQNFMIKNVYNEYGYLEAIKSPKEQIKDFDPEHFTRLIEKTLDDAIDSYEKSLEYQDKANQLKAQAVYYTKIAARYDAHKNVFLNIAKSLDAYAAKYEYYGMKYKQYSIYYKNEADKYMNLSNKFTGGRFGAYLSSYFKRLADKYNWYSSQYAHLTNYYLNRAISYRNAADLYEEIPNNYMNASTYYLNIANNAVLQSKEALEVAKYYSQRSEQGYSVNIAYQEILDDSEYNYFYKVLKQDSYSRVVEYLSGNGLITTKEYDSAGALNHIKTGYNFDDAIRELNFEYDKVANVTNREDKKLGVSQTYEYDNLNRVVSARTSTQNNYAQMNYAYDSIGNMTNKSDIGEYAYSSVNPHQVLNAGERTFTYDLNGNMTNNNGTIIEYTAFNKPSKLITKNDTAEFSYDTNQNRYKKSTEKYISYYIDKSYEQTLRKDNTTEDKYFIYVDSKVMSIYTNAISNSATKYLHYDSLSSVDTITNNLGVVEERMAYKPFGEKLNLDKYGKETQTPSYTNRGYTGHEHIQESNLIHMNARIYDPTIARFLSADSIVPYMYNTQSFNRYSYVRNNPLKYIDPSGHWGFSIKDIGGAISSGFKNLGGAISDTAKNIGQFVEDNWKTIVTVVVAVAVTVATFGAGMAVVGALGITNATLGAAVAGATMGAAGGFAAGITGTMLNGGTFRQALENGVKGAATGAIMGAISGGFGNSWNMERVMVNGMGGGVSSEIMGGRFEDGFKVAFLTAAAAYAYNSAVNYEATWKSGGDATNKDALDMPKSTNNNFGIAVRKPLNQRGFLEEGGWLSKQANNIPGMNSLAGLHDVFQVNLDVLQGSTDGWMRTVFNVPAMVPATVISYSALASEFVSPYLIIDNIRE